MIQGPPSRHDPPPPPPPPPSLQRLEVIHLTRLQLLHMSPSGPDLCPLAGGDTGARRAGRRGGGGEAEQGGGLRPDLHGAGAVVQRILDLCQHAHSTGGVGWGGADNMHTAQVGWVGGEGEGVTPHLASDAGCTVLPHAIEYGTITCR